MKNKLSIFKNIFLILIVFLTLIFLVSGIFQTMDKQTKKLNEATVEDIGFTYLSSLSAETVNHSKTYFSGKFESLNQTLNNIINMELSKKDAEEYLKQEITEGAIYVALFDENGKRNVLRGDESVHPYDMNAFEKAREENKEKVILTINDNGEKMVEMIVFCDFSIDDEHYTGLACGIKTETLNSVLNLSYDEEMVYSFIIRKKDSDFVIRNDDAVRNTYYERIRAMYGEYEGKTPDDYIEEIESAMKNDEEYKSIFYIENTRRMLYARPFSYSDWYIITFMHYDEMESLISENNNKRNYLFNSCFALLCGIFVITFSIYAVISYKQLKKQEELKRHAIEANRAKSEFLSNMSHDIRTPMNIIVGMTNIALANIENKEKTEDCLNKIARSSKHLLSLINDVLDMSKIESGKMTLSLVQISLRSAMDNLVSIAQPSLKSKNQKFDIYIDNVISEEVFCDSLRLNQILINLLSNAIKYTQDGGNITVLLYQEESPKGGKYVRTHFCVKDNGIGMTEEFQKIIFNDFVREDKERVRKEEGTGLGLAITKHIIDVMEGTIEVNSSPKEGSEFHVILDLEKGISDYDSINLGGTRVLVVDDDIDLCVSAVNSLKEIGAVSEYVTTGEQAVEKIQKSPDSFDVILVDWKMDGMDGLETSKKLREYITHYVPIILISAYDWGDIESQAAEAGINGFISKPLFKSTLFHCINQYLNNVPDVEIKEEGALSFNGEKLLLTEDNELNSEIAIAILNEAGFQVDWAENGQRCVEMFSNSPAGYYSAVLMDIRMPVMNGYEATEAIRKTGRSDSDIPIIAMTADAFSEDIAKAIKSGMNGHIAKPLDVNLLIDTLKRELNK